MAVSDEIKLTQELTSDSDTGLTYTITDATPTQYTPLVGSAGGTIPLTFRASGIPATTYNFPNDDKTERLAKRVKELEEHICDLIDIVAHLRAELYDA